MLIKKNNLYLSLGGIHGILIYSSVLHLLIVNESDVFKNKFISFTMSRNDEDLLLRFLLSFDFLGNTRDDLLFTHECLEWNIPMTNSVKVIEIILIFFS